MSIIALLKEAQQNGLSLSVCGDKLEIRGNLSKDVDQVVDKIKKNKKEILRHINSIGKRNNIPRIDKSNEYQEKLPLSPAQYGMWLDCQLNSETPLYVIRGIFDVEGYLNINKLEDCIQELIIRHTPLRYIFEQEDGIPFQKISSNTKFRADIFNAFGFEQDDINIKIIQYIQEPFDMKKGPLFKLLIVNTNENKQILVFKWHHIIADGVSVNVFLNELSSLYNDSNMELPKIKLDYKDYLNWVCQDSVKKYYREKLSFWENELDGRSLIDFPKLGLEKMPDEHAAGTFFFKIDDILSRQTREFAKHHHCTPYTILLTCYYILLGRYARTRDLIIGVPVANRHDLDLSNTFGLFVNTLPLRLEISNESFLKLVKNVQNKLLKMHDNQLVPFDLINKSVTKSESQASKLLQVLFNYVESSNAALQLKNTRISALELSYEYSAFLINMTVNDNENSFAVNIDYALDMFSSVSVSRFSEHYQELLRVFLKEPNVLVDNVSYLTRQENNLLFNEWNNTEQIEIHQHAISKSIKEQVTNNPLAVAVKSDNVEISYQQLDLQAKQVAGLLQMNGIEKNDLVLLLLEPSPLRIGALLGVMYAGAAYVPVEITLPIERIKSIILDAKPKYIISQNNLLSKINDIATGTTVFSIEHILNDNNDHDKTYKDITNDLEDLAYVIYTSGSTGKPKGVMIQHGGIANRLYWMQLQYKLNSSDCVLQKTPYSFDVSVWEFFWPLMVGACIVTIKPDGHKYPCYLLDQINKHAITVLHFVPSMLNLCLNIISFESCQALRYVFCSGEALARNDANKLMQVNGVALHNLYGPTEASVDVTYHTCKIHDEHLPVPIGKPISNMKVYILDEHLQPVPIGVPGELHLSGIGLAKGYMNLPELTAQKFIDNPYDNMPYDKLYKTGDLVKWGEDGEIYYLGRLDHQVKFHGLRIELGEIESAIMSFPKINRCIAMVISNNEIDKLVGCIQADDYVDIGQLRSHLERYLPDYMMPSQFVNIKEFPLTKNGKLDRDSLTSLVVSSAEIDSKKNIIRPRNSLEAKIATIWQDVLHVNAIDINANFFHVGGDSITLMQVIARMAKENIYITAKQFMEHKTIANLSGVVKLASFATTVQKNLLGSNQKLTPIQLWYFDQAATNVSYWHQLFKLKINKNLNVDLLEKSIKSVVDDHAIFKLRFEHNGSWAAYYQQEKNYLFESVDLQDLTYQQQCQTILKKCQEQHRSINIVTGPLAVFLHFVLGNNDERLVVIVNHLIIDGVSWRILIEDINNTYASFNNENNVVPLNATSTYQYWADSLSKSLTDRLTSKVKDYWLNFSTIKQNDISVDHELGLNSYETQSRVICTIDKDGTEKLLRSAIKYFDVHINSILLLPLYMAIYQYYGLPNILIDLESHGRDAVENIDVSRTLGWFTNIYPILLNCNKEDELNLKLKSIQKILCGVPNNGHEYLLFKYQETDKALSQQLRQLKPSISFNYLGQFRENIFDKTMFSMAEEDCGFPVSGDTKRPYKIDLVLVVVNDELRIDWNYSSNLFARDTIVKLSEMYKYHLELIIKQGVNNAE